MFISETTIRVRYAETDQMGVVYHGNYFPYFESARAEAIRELGLSYSDLEKMGIYMPVVEVQCRYFRPALYDELLTVRTILKELPGDHRIKFDQEVYNADKELLAAGHVILYFMEAQSKSKTGMPDTLRKRLLPFFQ